LGCSSLFPVAVFNGAITVLTLTGSLDMLQV
jgi:hypothetical protein